jgi:biotin carboxylase/isopentenyl diphosphate isomerase/L-lactate dehydrogenase-like FMN-dependent dehydrogenase
MHRRASGVQKRIMIIGAGILQVPAIRIAKEMGLQTVVTDYNEDAYGMRLADFPIVMSTRDVDGTVRIAKEFSKKHPIHGVITVGTDASLTVAAVQHALDLPGNRIDVAEATTNKIKMRSRLREHNVPEPDFHPCWTYKDVTRAAETLGFPFVIKPADNMGARGVMKVEKPEVIRFAYERAKNASPRGEIIAEGFMDGPELSIDALVWEGTIHITGVADRIIEFPPYFVETGHIMPTNLPEEMVTSGLDVFRRGIEALGIEIGAAKGDIKLTGDGAMVGEIASRLSGGFMSAYTYPYATGVNLIWAAIRIALGEPPGELRESLNRVSVERAIIPGSGTVRDIQGIEDALSIEGVKNVFITTAIGETVHIPTSNVEKCGNVIAVGETRDEAFSRANLGVQTVKILLGTEGELNEGGIRKDALVKLSGVCSVCSVCDGVECAGWMPGIGSCGSGEGFKRNLRVLREHVILSDVFSELDNVNTGSDLFGIPLDLPVLPSPISDMRHNMRGVFKDEEYNRYILRGASKAGSIGCLAESEYRNDKELQYLLKPLEDASGHGIPFFNPFSGQGETIRKINRSFEAGARAVGLSVDLRDRPTGDRRLAELIGQSPLPVIVKGILTPENAASAVEAGARGLVLSNRGGRILENLPSAHEMVDIIKECVPDDILLLVDGGLRNGEDVFKALALGADLVLIGRPLFIFCAGALSDGVSYYLNKIRNELRNTMLHAGAKTVSSITPAMIRRIPAR